MRQKNTFIQIIKFKVNDVGQIDSTKFSRINSTENKIITPVMWNFTHNKSILELSATTELEIVCSRCLSLVKKIFKLKKKYKIFNTIVEAEKYSNIKSNKLETIAVEEKLTLTSLIEDEILFEFLKIIRHEGCFLPTEKYEAKESSDILATNKIHVVNPFAKLKEKFDK